MSPYSNKGLNEIDGVAYILSRSENFGNEADWLANWRNALNGVQSRSDGMQHSYRNLTEWLPGLPLWNPDNEVAVCLFFMDSTLECWTFALNALGFGVLPSQFHDIGNSASLKRISPECIIGKLNRRSQGFDTVFPSVSELWRQNEESIRIIIENHDVSKHRHWNLFGWASRADPPPGILEAHGVSSWLGLGPYRVPMSQILLPRDPKLPRRERQSGLNHWVDLIQLKPKFDHILDMTSKLALKDVRNYVNSSGKKVIA